jgi:hypothetical protein
MSSLDEYGTGYDTPEEAARGDIPERFVTIVGVRWITDDNARVWMVTNDRPTYESYEADCFRKGSRWYYDNESGGFSIDTPQEVRETAVRLCPGFNRG